MDTETSDDVRLAPLVKAVLAVADEDDAMSVLTSVPDGWAKLDGRWVRMKRVTASVDDYVFPEAFYMVEEPTDV